MEMRKFFPQYPNTKLEYTLNSLILKEIIEINFSELSFLSLLANNIESIEGIEKMKMPKLRQFFIDSNRINRMKNILKICPQSLTQFGLSDNPIQDSQQLTKWQAKKLQIIQIEFLPEDCLISNDLRWLFKMKNVESKCLRIVRARSRRIGKSPVEKMLKKIKKSIVFDCNKSVGFRALEEEDE